ncbi:MAG: hypothetical protein ABFD57_05645 [Smithella sp.]
MKKSKWTFVVFLIAFFIAGCAHSPDIDKFNDRQDALQKRGIFELPPSDTDIIREALLLLNKQEGEPDYNEAKARLATLIQKYPKSKWAGSAQAFVLTIDHLLALKENVKTQSTALDNEKVEKAKLIKDYKSAEERNRAEIGRLQQENEQLKKDIALLKKLEIQLDKREKLLK